MDGFATASGIAYDPAELREKKPERKRKNLIQLGVDYSDANAWMTGRFRYLRNDVPEDIEVKEPEREG